MNKLMPVFIFGLVASYISDKNSKVSINRYGDREYKRKEKLFFILLTIVLAVFVGLRTGYNDTGTYRHMYESLSPGLGNILSLNFSLGANPGFWITNTILKTIGVSTQNYLMFYALITVCIYLWFIRKYSDDIWLSVFLFFTMGCYTFTMAAIKQCVAVAFCLIAVDRIMQDKRKAFIFWILVAATFHPYSLMYLVVPFLTFNPWSGKTYVLLILFAVIGFSLQPLLGTVVDITTLLGEEYDASTFVGESINIFRLLVIWVPVILSFLTKRYQQDNNTKIDNIILNLTMLNAEIMFIGLFGTANYFARLANYFLIFQALCLPHLFRAFTKDSQKIMKVLCIIGFLAYFYYANVINLNFDRSYFYLPFIEYLKSIVRFLI